METVLLELTEGINSPLNCGQYSLAVFLDIEEHCRQARNPQIGQLYQFKLIDDQIESHIQK